VDEEESVSPPAAPQQRVIEVASAMLAGEIGIIEGSRLLCSLRSCIPLSDHDPDFLPFVGIDGETDHLPVGDVRQHWASDAHARKDQEIQAAETFYRERARSGCEHLLTRFNATTMEQDHY
jgi:hypothetical protein